MTTFIKKIRLHLGLSRKELAQSLGLTYGAISNYESGVRKPQLSICYRLIDLAKQHNMKLNLEDIYPRSD